MHSAVFVDNSNSQKGQTVVNCSFENIMGTNTYCAGINIFNGNANINISCSIFKNISSSHGSTPGGAINYAMSTTNNGRYNISANTFIEIKTNRSVIQLSGGFTSFTFGYNLFFNVSSVNEGGVYLFIIINLLNDFFDI
jgi:hypothetical protein